MAGNPWFKFFGKVIMQRAVRLNALKKKKSMAGLVVKSLYTIIYQ
jgi:hypothetical protein